MLLRASLRGGGVRLPGEPEGVPPGPPPARRGVLERLEAGFTGQSGDPGAGVCGVPGGQRNGVPGFKEGQEVEPSETGSR